MARPVDCRAIVRGQSRIGGRSALPLLSQRRQEPRVAGCGASALDPNFFWDDTALIFLLLISSFLRRQEPRVAGLAVANTVRWLWIPDIKPP